MIKIYANENLLEAISLALSQDLYVPGFELKRTMLSCIDFIEESLKDGKSINIKIALFFDNNIPVGIIFTAFNNETQIFVKDAFRRQGIATALSHAIHKIIDAPLNVHIGIPESTLFFNTLSFLVQS